MKDNTNSEEVPSAPILITEEVEAIVACCNDLMVVAEAIIQSCNLVENMDEAHGDLFVVRAEALKRLASLYNLRQLRKS
jgi:hypothetical protein